jgi:5-methylcytosine-specific restriction protein B
LDDILVDAAHSFRPLIDWAYSAAPVGVGPVEPPAPAIAPTQAHAVTLEELSEATLWEPDDLAEVIETLTSKRPHAILAGPPGTSKTWVARAIVAHLTEGDPGRVVPIQFHPSYTYEEFVEGLRPVAEDGFVSFKPTQGTIFRAVDRAGATEGSVYLLIDEINRANLSRVFGELMQLLEYRDTPIDLQYSVGFSLPANLGIIATMNTADRSIRSIDVALRRRFEFFECRPSRDILELFYAYGRGVNTVSDLGDGFDALNAWLTEQVDRHHTIGHAYLMADVLDAARLRHIWRRQLLPLIEDFFFDRPDETDHLEPTQFWPSLKT